MRKLLAGALAWMATTGLAYAAPEQAPRVERRGEAVQLIVKGQPTILLAGELHNSSASSPAYMAPIWDKLAQLNVQTVIGVASWELVEPVEGSFNFAEVDDQIGQAKARGMNLVMIWFGAYKNAESTYAPSWVRRDENRFTRAERDPNFKTAGMASFLRFNPVLSVFDPDLARADARAFAALMRHIRQVDRDGTVIMVQVENEVGLLADSRDRSPPARAAWESQVPADLIGHLERNRGKLKPHLEQLWGRQGYRTSGTWGEVFGTDKAADEVFTAWGFSRYVDSVARTGAAEHALPMFANAWLGPQPRAPEPGDYPSGGPVARMMDVWKAGAPSLALLAPDIYIDDFAGTLADFSRADNGIFIPEARPIAGNLFVALGEYKAIGFSPFGIEDVAPGSDLAQAYGVLRPMLPHIAAAQAAGTIRGFKFAQGGRQELTMGGYKIVVTGPMRTTGLMGEGTGSEQAKAESYGLVIQQGEDEFLFVGRGISPSFSATGAKVEIDGAQEGTFVAGRWTPGRTLNGDERFALFSPTKTTAVRIRLLRRPG
jgi:beta-galactosidase GanA